jgi:predicted transcriptional regulator
MRTLTWPQVLARRLERHHLSKPAPRDRLLAVVGELCGIHAQVPISADLSIGARVARVTRADVQHELWERRTLVRTYGIRGTVHLFPADELAMWLSALRANPAQNRQAVLDMLKIDQARMDAMIEAIADALDGRMLTRDELGAEIVARVGRWAGAKRFPAFGDIHPVWTPAIGHAATAGALCFGPNAGTKVRFVRPDQWIGTDTRRGVGADAALGEVLRRYLAAYGPATLAEFAQWFAATRPTAARAARALAGETVEVEVEGTPALALAADERATDRPARRRGSVRLLPSFDVYIVGSHPRDVLIPPAFVEHARRHPASLKWAVAGRAQFAGPIPVLVVDGVVSGMWRRTGTSGRIRIEVEPFVELSKRQLSALDVEAGRVGAILGGDVALSVGKAF